MSWVRDFNREQREDMVERVNAEREWRRGEEGNEEAPPVGRAGGRRALKPPADAGKEKG